MPEGKCVATTSVGATCGRPWSSWRRIDRPALAFGGDRRSPLHKGHFFPSENRMGCRRSLQFLARPPRKRAAIRGMEFADLLTSKESSCEWLPSFSSSWYSRSLAC